MKAALRQHARATIMYQTQGAQRVKNTVVVLSQCRIYFKALLSHQYYRATGRNLPTYFKTNLPNFRTDKQTTIVFL